MANTKNSQVSVKKSRPDVSQWHSDVFTVRDGRFVGHDGFIVPKDFGEFFSRFPRYVSNWVCKTIRKRANDADAEDLTQELLLHLQCLPADSKYRVEGKQDVIQVFDPKRMHGANEARFRSYINLCLANRFNSIYVRDKKNPVCRPGNLTFGFSKEHDTAIASDEYCHAHSSHLRDRARREAKRRSDDERVAELLGQMMGQHQSKSFRAVMAYRATGSWRKAASAFRVTEKQCRLARRELRASRHLL